MLYHVLMPASDGFHVSLDYREDLTEALDALRYWRKSPNEDMAISKGPNGEPLRWVFWVEDPDISGRGFSRMLAVSVHATRLGAKRAFNRYSREPGEGVRSWGMMPVREWGKTLVRGWLPEG
jgi:hypothetical protein